MITVSPRDARTRGLCEDRDQASPALASTAPSLPWSLLWQVPCQLIKQTLTLAGRGGREGDGRKSVKVTRRVKSYSQDSLHYILSQPKILCFLVWLLTHSSIPCPWQDVRDICSASKQGWGTGGMEWSMVSFPASSSPAQGSLFPTSCLPVPISLQ